MPGQAGLSLAAMVSRVGVDPATLDSRVDALVTAGQAVRAGDVLVSPPIVARLEGRDRGDADRAPSGTAAV